MTSQAGPWSVKGIDPRAREMAKDLARRSGMTLGEWLNQMIVEGLEPEPPPFEPPPRSASEPLAFDRHSRARAAAPTPARDSATLKSLEQLAARLEAAEHRSTLAISGIDQSVMGVLSRIEGVERDQSAVAARFDGALDEVRDVQGRLADKLRKMTDAEAPRAEALRALETSLGKVAAQLHEAETRSRAGFGEAREDMTGVQRRLERLEAGAQGAGGAEESIVARLAERIEAAESRTNAAVRALEVSFAGLDARLARQESEIALGGELSERRFGKLAAELSEKVEAARAEMAQKFIAAPEGKLDRIESALAEMNGHVQAAEQRSAAAIDRMGREVVRIAHSIGGRVQAVETRSAQAVEQVGGEMARIADAMEARMRSADAAQAEALEKLGAEIGRIAEKLADRIAATERRSAQAIDDVGDQVVTATEKIQQRYDNVAGDLADRIRQSEERTARVLEEARVKLEQRLTGGPARPAAEPLAAPATAPRAAVDLSPAPAYVAPPPPAPAHMPPRAAVEVPPQAAVTPEPAAAYDDEPLDMAAFGDDAYASELLTDDDGFVALPTDAAPLEQEAIFEDAESASFEDMLSTEDPFAPVMFHGEPVAELEPMLEPDFGATAAQPVRPPERDLLESAREAARQAAAGRRAAPEGPGARRGFSFSLPRKKRKEAGPTLRTALLASGTAATLSMAVAGYGLLSTNQQNDAAKAPAESAPAPAAAAPAPAAPVATDQAALTPPTAVAPAQSNLAVALSPPAASAPAPAAAPPAAAPATTAPAVLPAPAAADQARAYYLVGVRQIESGDSAGLEPLRRAANLGDAGAQFYLSKLYETGGAGLKKDIVEARRWTERAAAGGDAKAMHNLGLYFFEGSGGQKSTAEAAAWFRRAADLGLQDSQYNLGRLYEEGFGVAKNLAESYKWYLIASTGGDPEARSGAERVRKLIPPDAQTTAQRSASAFRAQISGAMVNAAR